MSLIDELPPRAWTDVFVPTAPPNVEWFDFYTEWLADYLFATEIPLHPRQLEYAYMVRDRDPEKCIFDISNIYGYTIYEIDGLEHSYETGEGWDTYDARQRDWWDNEVDSEMKQEETADGWLLSKMTWYLCREEWLEERQYVSQFRALPTHADIPFRALLALAIKRIPERARRIKSVRRYFINFSDNASK